MAALAKNKDEMRLQRFSRWATVLAIVELASLVVFFMLFTGNSDWDTALSDDSTSARLLRSCIVVVATKALAIFLLPWLARQGVPVRFVAELAVIQGFFLAPIFILIGGAYFLAFPFLFFDAGSTDPNARFLHYGGLLTSTFVIADSAFGSALFIHWCVEILVAGAKKGSTASKRHI